MIAIKSLLKCIAPVFLWDFFRTRQAIILDVVTNLGATLCTINYQGFAVYYSRGNTLIYRIRSGKIFEKELSLQIADDLSHSQMPSMIDVGANLGLISLYVLSKVAQTKIYAFEPGPAQRALLEKTVERNRLEKSISIYSCALGKEAGVAKFTTHKDADVAKDGFIDTGRGSDTVSIEVAVETLDVWWKAQGKPAVDVVKIDTEGAELWVIQGGKEFFSLVKPIIYLEIEATNLRVYPYMAEDILKFLTSIGYQLSTLEGQECTEKNLGEMMKRCDTFRAVSRI